MRLSEILSRPLSSDFKQVDGFLNNSKLKAGKQKKISVGIVGINFYCTKCNDIRTFCSNDELYRIGVHDQSISIDCVLHCPQCGASIPLWFLIESKDSIFEYAPKVRILKRSIKFSENVQPNSYTYGDFSELLDKAELAYREELGAGAIIYLRKIYEKIASQAADAFNIEKKDASGNRKKFKTLLKEVDKACSIIPSEFSENKYALFEELSEIIHGTYDESEALKKYISLKRLIIGILENVKSHDEMANAIGILNLSKDKG